MDNTQKTILKVSGLILGVLVFLSLFVKSCTQIEAGEVGIETRLGKVSSGALGAGLYFTIPGITKINRLNTKIQTVEQDSQAASYDLQNVQTQLTLNYHLGATDPISHFIRLGNNQEQMEASIVKPAMSEAFKAVVAQYNAEQLITKRDIVSTQIVNGLSNKLKQYDLFVDSVSVTNFAFSKAFSDAIEAKQVAEQHANKAKNDLVRIQVEAQQEIVRAQAKAQAMQLQKTTITPELLQLKYIEKWDGHLPQYNLGGATPLINLGKI